MRGAGRLVDWLAPEVPVERLAVTRLLVGAFATGYVLVRFRYLADHSRHAAADFQPVGLATLLPAPLPAAVSGLLVGATVLLGAAFAAGRRVAITGPTFFAVLTWVLSYANSWGKILHSENLFVLQVGVLALAGSRPDPRAAGWVLRLAAIVTVLAYVLAGVTKLRAGAGAWLSGDTLREWLAWDALRKIELGSFSSPLAPALASLPLLAQGLAVFTLVVELGAPLALASPRVAKGWALLAWSFHLGILATMAIGFFYPLSGIAFAPLLAVERLPLVRRFVAQRPR